MTGGKKRGGRAKKAAVLLIGVALAAVCLNGGLRYWNEPAHILQRHLKDATCIAQAVLAGERPDLFEDERWRIFYRPEEQAVIFMTGGSGFGSQTNYRGFYYSAQDTPHTFGMSEALTPEENGWRYWGEGDNEGFTRRIQPCWFSYKEHY